MKRYKLIKKYPGSPELGTIAYKNNDYNMRTIVYEEPGVEKPRYISSTEKGYFEKMISSQPEFWEEVVEKDYEILSFVNNGTTGGKKGFIVPLQDDGFYYANKPTLETCLELPYLDIHSVKRLSDGEVFTVGDKINNSPGARLTDTTIKGFDINSKYFVITNTGREKLENIEHRIKQPLFTTEDGVDIYEGDKFYELITPNFHNKPCIWNILEYNSKSNIIYDQEGNRKNGRIWFSTKKAAEEYVLLNKQCLSFNDLIKNGILGQNKTVAEQRLVEVIKSKINKIL